MERIDIRRLLTPELILFLFGVFLALGVMVRTSTGECHQWKDRLGRVAGAYLAAAGEREFPAPGIQTVAEDRERLRRATSRMLDDRPFGCF